MKLSITLAAIVLLCAGVFSPATAQAAPSDWHRREVRSDYDDYHHHHHHKHRHYRTIRVYVPGHYVWYFGHRHWVPGHFEYRQIVYWR